MSGYDQRKLLYELMSSEEHYNNFINASIDPFFVHSMDVGVIEVNNAACQSLGYTRKELLDAFVWDIEVAITQEMIEKNLSKLAEGPIKLEGCHKRKDGSIYPVDVSLSIFHSRGERYVLAIVRDISEQKRSESMARKITNALDQSPLLAVLLQKKGIIEYVNETVLQKTGFKMEHILGKNYKHFLADDLSKDMLNQLEQNKKWQGEIVIKDNQGTCSKVLATISTIYDKNAKQIFNYLAILDISALTN